MKFKSSCKIVLLAAALTLPTAAFAQFDISVSIEAQSAILDAGKIAAKINSLHNVPSVGVINLNFAFASPFSQSGNDVATLKIYAERNAAGINQLHHALSANPVTRRALAAHGVNISQVVGIGIGSSGSLRVFKF
jgi:hypothetical protein